MPERPKPDIEHTREALRQHDERVESEEDAEREDAEPESAQSDDDEKPDAPH